jgi:hypothetical protein
MLSPCSQCLCMFIPHQPASTKLGMRVMEPEPQLSGVLLTFPPIGLCVARQRLGKHIHAATSTPEYRCWIRRFLCGPCGSKVGFEVFMRLITNNGGLWIGGPLPQCLAFWRTERHEDLLERRTREHGASVRHAVAHLAC